MKKRIYKWHRTSSLIIAIPVILWAASGFMHPIMTNIRPKVATQFIMPSIIDSSKVTVRLKNALEQNKIDSFVNFRFIHIDTNWFYQVQIDSKQVPVYLSTKNGKNLQNGDWLYAQYLARIFLEGQTKDSATPFALSSNVSHDCCDAAAECVLNNKKGAPLDDAVLVTSFNDEYKSINCLLPVYKVSFKREDGIRIYVETTQDRFSFAMDNKRFVFDRIFTLLHTWGWLAFLGKGKVIIEFLLVSLAFLTTIMGIYIFFITKTKKVAGNEVVRARRNHRFTSIIIALFTLMFTFSGAYHSFNKIVSKEKTQQFVETKFASAAINLNLASLHQIVHQPITNISIVKIDGQDYWQVNSKKGFTKLAPKTEPNKDLMKAKSVPPPSAIYVNTSDASILKDGEIQYAKYLAGQFGKHENSEVKYVEPITKFEGEYGFVNKRLPVFKVGYATNRNERYYVETSSGKLSTRIDDAVLLEGYSFALLHKHEFMAWAGKPVKDFSTMFWAAAQIAMVTIGLILYFKWRRKKKQHTVE
jgi:hypothetical protein